MRDGSINVEFGEALSSTTCVLHHIPKWSNLIFSVVAVHTIVHGDKSNITVREVGVGVISHLQIISAEA